MTDKRIQNEELFQKANEILENRFRKAGVRETARFICECSDVTCMRNVGVDLETFTGVRERRDRYVIVDGHQDDAIERVVERRDRFIIVEKMGDTTDG